MAKHDQESNDPRSLTEDEAKALGIEFVDWTLKENEDLSKIGFKLKGKGKVGEFYEYSSGSWGIKIARAKDKASLERLYHEIIVGILASQSEGLSNRVPHVSNIVYKKGLTLYIIMDAINGQDLSKVKMKDQDVRENVYIQLAEIHELLIKAKIAHKDISPLNFMIDQDGKVYIVDFGTSIAFEDANHETHKNYKHGGVPTFLGPKCSTKRVCKYCEIDDGGFLMTALAICINDLENLYNTSSGLGMKRKGDAFVSHLGWVNQDSSMKVWDYEKSEKSNFDSYIKKIVQECEKANGEDESEQIINLMMSGCNYSRELPRRWI